MTMELDAKLAMQYCSLKTIKLFVDRKKFKYFYDSFQELFTIHFAEVYLIFLQGFSRPVFGPFTNISFFLGKSSGEVQYFEKLEDH